ncbi:hydrolase TatD [Nesterenkonia sp. AN1]|uniref:TatD DNase family protein n=1 Tax=Nesterenkonia aurantiaca TaxID=1436010 RepID=A0A4R7G5R5_9MICC|nr:hydrolase TatD [Nesterenkonia sp. AN1]TDS86512.1 TatD DNase family protein [Nesterenkonia aurantiaca]
MTVSHQQRILPDAESSPAAVAGETPPAYRPAPSDDDGARPVSAGASPASEASADAFSTEAATGAATGPARDQAEEKSGKKRRLQYPPAPEPLAVPVIDNHAHLDFRDGEISVSVQQALEAARAVGVVGALCVGYDVASSEFSVNAAAEHPALKAAVALHPNDAPVLAAQGDYETAFAQITELARHDQVVAIGETGLDFYRTGEEGIAAQRRSFEDHIALAVERGLAMQIHDRQAHAEVVEVLNAAPTLPSSVVFHCFSGDADLARICNANGWYMSFAGSVTFKNARALREALAVADPQLILVETDTPFLTPHPYRGQPNAPYLIPQTMRLMAQVRDTGLDSMCQQVMFNTTQAYGSWT